MTRINIGQKFADDFISREAGEKLRNLILETAEDGDSIEIDFGGKIIASTSFFDEGFAKLAEYGWTKEKLLSIRLKNINERDLKVLMDLFGKRVSKKGKTI